MSPSDEPTPEDGNGDTKAVPRPRFAAPGRECFYAFVPQPGATADELAAAMELLMLGLVVLLRKAPPELADAMYSHMDEAAKRHWEVKEPPRVMPVHLHVPPGARPR